QMSQTAKLEPFLGVLKKHRYDKFLVSHGLDGYSLALDYKVTERNWIDLQALAHSMNDVVLEAGGRFYLAKDSTLRPEDVERYLGTSLDRFRELKAQLDPENLLTSDQAARVFKLCVAGNHDCSRQLGSPFD
ncbi:MAG: FAD-binding oxidoreductase, partial [Chlorobia bacterium]|nr:FAD-binding oxidoreductase [Fimbriimonadaceae bacterium]